jgi:DNA-binding transcriptional regulator YdaS (Cro superfamily)
MDIKAYLEKHELSQEQFAKQLGVSQGLVWQWLDGRTRITAERAVEIEEKTAGEVTRRDLRPDLYPPSERVAA